MESVRRRPSGAAERSARANGAWRHAGTNGVEPRAKTNSAEWEIWGSKVVLRVTDPRALDLASGAVRDELAAIDRACSRFRTDSEISEVNARAGRAARISRLLGEALELALRAAELTDGDVDPTIGSALVLKGYDRDWSLLERPRPDTRPAAAAATAMATTDGTAGDMRPRHERQDGRPGRTPVVLAQRICGWRNVMFDRKGPTLRIPAGTMIDLGATAKAWAADRAARAAAQTGECGALVSVGGDIAVAGQAPTDGWMVHVTDDHRADHRAPGQTVAIERGGLATSSIATRRWRHEGEEMHHIIDPRTGAPVRGSWRTVSVAAASCADANIATTAALVRGGGAPAWLTQMGVPARLVSANGRVYTIGDWPAEQEAR
jgi:thiamine biosynthesis lipoprotein ApbE